MGTTDRLLAGPPSGRGGETYAEHERRLGPLPPRQTRRDVIPTLEASGLLGRGGAAFPVGRKWRTVAERSEEYENGWNAINQFIREDYSWNGREPNVFYVRRNGRYYDFSGVSGLNCALDSRAFAVTDLDGDGNLDLLLKSRLGPQVKAFRNDSAGGRQSLAIRLVGMKSNRDAIGARVEVDGVVKFLQAGSGYISQHTKALHFGLSDAGEASKISILWPSGARQ